MKSEVPSVRQFVAGLALALAAPSIVLAVLAGWVHWVNAAPQEGRVRTSVSPEVVFPGGRASYRIVFEGRRTEVAPKPLPPVDVVFLIDLSASMKDSLPKMADAAIRVAHEMTAANPGQVRLALIGFDSRAEIESDWTDDADAFARGIAGLRSEKRPNDTRPAFEKLKQLLSKVRPGSRRAAVFYTDGELDACPGCPRRAMSNDEMVAEAKALRSDDVELYAIVKPDWDPPDLLENMTGDETRVLEPANLDDLIAKFRVLKSNLQSCDRQDCRPGSAQLMHRIDGRHFATPLGGTPWHVGRDGALHRDVSSFAESTNEFGHAVVPLSSGLWMVGTEPPSVTVTAPDGEVSVLVAPRRPRVLAIGWSALFLSALPALAWCALALLPRRVPPARERRRSPNVVRRPPPSRLPVLPTPLAPPRPPVPTLFVGLGGAGRRALAAIRAELIESDRERLSDHRFLWIDVDANPVTVAAAFGDAGDSPLDGLLAPPDLRQMGDHLPSSGADHSRLRWFDVARYRNAARAALQLSDGTKGDRSLARLALFTWLAREGEPAATLAARRRDLQQILAVDGTRQIVVLASRDGGVGSGWFLDVGRLLHRTVRRAQQAEGGLVPEIIGVLGDSPERSHPANRAAIGLEIETAMLAGRFPMPLTYVPGSELLDAQDLESPYDWLLTVAGRDDQAVASQAAELAATLVQRRPRAAVLDETAGIDRTGPVRATTHAVHVMPALVRERVRVDLVLRLLGPDVLADLTVGPDGRLVSRPTDEREAQAGLDEWSTSEPAGSLLSQLLQIAKAPDAAREVEPLRAAVAGSESLSASFTAAVNQRLHGRRTADGRGWERVWMPARAMTILALLAKRLRTDVVSRLSAGMENANVVAVVEELARLADDVAGALRGWLDGLADFSVSIADQQAELGRAHDARVSTWGRLYLKPPTAEDISRWARESLTRWLGNVDTISAIRQRLFMVVVMEGSTAAVVVRSYVERDVSYRSAAEAARAIDEFASRLASSVPTAEVAGGLATLPANERMALGRQLVDVGGAARRVVIVQPPTERVERSAREALTTFVDELPQPANEGERHEVEGDDCSAVRRIGLAPETAIDLDGDSLVFIEAADQAAERLRRRAEARFGRAVPKFPPALRLALAFPDSFRSFARAYRMGRIVRRPDDTGAQQWLLDGGEFLTSGKDDALATAAASYVWYVRDPPVGDAAPSAADDVARLDRWRSGRAVEDDDLLTLIAIAASEDEGA